MPSLAGSRFRNGAPPLVVFAFFAFPLFGFVSDIGTASIDEREISNLVPGVPLERELRSGERRRFAIDASPQPQLITVEQRGINVALHATPADGAGDPVPGLSNLDGQREGWETLLLPARPAGSTGYRLEVIARDAVSLPGRFVVRLDPLSGETVDGRHRVEGEEILSEIGRLRARGDGASTRRIAELAERALPAFRAAGRPHEVARTLFLEAEAYLSLGEAKSAVPLAERAVKAFSALGADAAESQAEALFGLGLAATGDTNGAIARFERALAIEIRRGDAYGEATTRANVCLARQSRGEWRESIPCYEEAIEKLRRVQAVDTAAIAGGNLGGIYDLLGEPEKARAAYEAALPLLRALGEKRGEVSVLNNLGVLLAEIGETSEALERYGQALERAAALGDRGWQARIRQNRGVAYLAAGDEGRAARELEQALALRRAAGDRRGEVTTLGLLGSAKARLGETSAAEQNLEAAIALAHEARWPAQEANALQQISRIYASEGKAALALTTAQSAVDLFRGLNDRRGLAASLSRRGEALTLAGESEAALAPLSEALAIRRSLDDRAGASETLTALAEAERRLKRRQDARAHVREALDLVEVLRSAVVAPELRASFLAGRVRTFDLALELTLDGAETSPSERAGGPRPIRGDAVEAGFALAERARARSLLDLLTDARAAPGGIEPDLRRRAREIGERLAAKARRRIESLANGAPDARSQALAHEIDDLLAEDDRLKAEIAAANQNRSTASSTTVATVATVATVDSDQARAMLRDDELLIELALGERTSYLWALTRGEISAYELPPRAELERLARRVYEDLRKTELGDRRADDEERSARRELSRLVLGPIASRLGDHRLLVVADGALLYVPFSALPIPGDSNDLPLIERHEVTSLPSASVLAALRTPGRGRPEAKERGRRAILVGDPVFSPFDPRVRNLATSVPPTRPGDRAEPPVLQRLASTRREVEAIGALPVFAVGPRRATTLLGFAADRAAVLAGALDDGEILHLATHGVIDTETPRLSGLVLSLVDERGAPREGFLGLADLYGLSLQADLVVLSGCETALGREMRGEGLVGLTGAFFEAGARSVIASLWRVQDRPTAELMIRFYRAHLEEGLSPAAALRAAQRSLRKDRRTRDPAYWAGFVLFGNGGKDGTAR